MLAESRVREIRARMLAGELWPPPGGAVVSVPGGGVPSAAGGGDHVTRAHHVVSRPADGHAARSPFQGRALSVADQADPVRGRGRRADPPCGSRSGSIHRPTGGRRFPAGSGAGRCLPGVDAHRDRGPGVPGPARGRSRPAGTTGTSSGWHQTLASPLPAAFFAWSLGFDHRRAGLEHRRAASDEVDGCWARPEHRDRERDAPVRSEEKRFYPERTEATHLPEPGRDSVRRWSAWQVRSRWLPARTARRWC